MSEKDINNLDYENVEQMIVGRTIESRVPEAFLEYSMSVIVSRALPDVRDGIGTLREEPEYGSRQRRHRP